MDVFYVEVEGGNFGDDMNLWFWSELFPEHRDLAPGTTLFGIGSVLWRDNLRAHDSILVLGSGSGYGTTPEAVPDHVRVAWVRGPRTGARLKLDPAQVITDPACMVPTFPEFRDIEPTGETILMPHVGTARLALDWDEIAARAGASYLSPAGDSKAIIRRLAGAKLVVTESLHGAILADAFRVPWVAMGISPTFNSYKWLDWGDSMEMPMRIAPCLTGFKRLYALQGRARSWVKGLRASTGSGATATGAAAKARAAAETGAAEFSLSRGEKDRARALFRRFKGPLGAMIARDVRRATKGPTQLSDERVLRGRQDAITRRIEEVRASLRQDRR